MVHPDRTYSLLAPPSSPPPSPPPSPPSSPPSSPPPSSPPSPRQTRRPQQSARSSGRTRPRAQVSQRTERAGPSRPQPLADRTNSQLTAEDISDEMVDAMLLRLLEVVAGPGAVREILERAANDESGDGQENPLGIQPADSPPPDAPPSAPGSPTPEGQAGQACSAARGPGQCMCDRCKHEHRMIILEDMLRDWGAPCLRDLYRIRFDIEHLLVTLRNGQMYTEAARTVLRHVGYTEPAVNFLTPFIPLGVIFGSLQADEPRAWGAANSLRVFRGPALVNVLA